MTVGPAGTAANALTCRDERDCGRGFLSGVVWPAPALPGLVPRLMSAHAFSAWSGWFGCGCGAWFLRVLQEMLVLRDIPEVPGRLMGDGRAVCP